MENVSGEAAPGSKPLSVLAVDKVAVLKNNRARYRMLVERANVDVTLIAPKRWPENCVMEVYQPDAADPYTTILGTVSWPGRELLSIYWTGLVRAMRKARPDVILMMEEAFSMFALQVVLLQPFLAPGAKMIFYSNHIGSYRPFPYRLRKLYNIISKIVFRRTEVGYCVNEKAERMLAETSFRGERRIRFHGINQEVFTEVPRCRARREIGMPEDCHLFLFAGRLIEPKGVQDLIDAFARLRAERVGEPLRLLIVGDGEYAGALHAKVSELGLDDVVEFRRTVPVEKVSTYMCAATAFVLPSRGAWKEQFGRVNAEAMLVGTTIIGSTSGEIPSIIGEGGFIFQADDIDDLQWTMARVLDDHEEVERRRRIGREFAVREYSVHGFVEDMISLFERMGGRSLRRRRKG